MGSGWQPEAGGSCCCLPGRAKPSGRLLEVRGVDLDDWLRFLEGVEEVWELIGFLVSG